MTPKMFESQLLAISVIVALAPPPVIGGDDPEPIEQLVKRWEKQVRIRLDKDDKLKTLAAKHPLVVLHSRYLYCKGDYKQSVFSFIYETADRAKHRNDVQLQFDNGGTTRNTFEINMVVGQQNLVVDLGLADFAKDPELAKISIDHPGMVLAHARALEGHVYLERIRDDGGNNFYVLFQIVAVDKDGRYMGFLWRKIPGGTVIKQKGGKGIAVS